MKRKPSSRPAPGQSAANKALAVAAHPDDIEFCMAGTLLLLGELGWELHYLTLASGSCGSLTENAARTRILRRKESLAAARILGAQHHSSLADDLEVLYSLELLRRLAAIIRTVQPSVLLTHSPEDYMEDHVNTCRLAVTAAFARGMPNFRTLPPRPAYARETVVYHAMPHGLCDGLGRAVLPEFFVDTGRVQETKKKALAAHGSQQQWLDASQGLSSFLDAMEEMSRAVGKMSRSFLHAEGWRRHSHLGFSSEPRDPIKEALGPAVRENSRYRRER